MNLQTCLAPSMWPVLPHQTATHIHFIEAKTFLTVCPGALKGPPNPPTNPQINQNPLTSWILKPQCGLFVQKTTGPGCTKRKGVPCCSDKQPDSTIRHWVKCVSMLAYVHTYATCGVRLQHFAASSYSCTVVWPAQIRSRSDFVAWGRGWGMVENGRGWKKRQEKSYYNILLNNVSCWSDPTILFSCLVDCSKMFCHYIS